MKFILSFLIVTTILSAGSSSDLSLGNAALTPNGLCAQSNNLAPPAQVVSQCTPAPATPTPPIAYVIGIRNTSGNTIKCPDPAPTSPTPEPSSYALLGVGLMTAGFARKFLKKQLGA